MKLSSNNRNPNTIARYSLESIEQAGGNAVVKSCIISHSCYRLLEQDDVLESCGQMMGPKIAQLPKCTLTFD